MDSTLVLLQAGSLRLHDPVDGPAQALGRFQSDCARGRYPSADRLFQTAIRERVDLLTLSGHLLGTPCAGSRAPWYLWQRFRELEQLGIAVIVGSDQLPHPPVGVVWPGNVHLVSPLLPAQVTLRNGRLLSVADLCSRRFQSRRPGQQLLVDLQVSAHLPRLESDGEPIQFDSAFGELGELQPDLHAPTHAFQQPGARLMRFSVNRRFDPQPIDCRILHKQRLSIPVSASETWAGVVSRLKAQLTTMTRSSIPTVLEWELTGDLHSPAWQPISYAAQQQLLQELRAQAPVNIWISSVQGESGLAAPRTEAHQLASAILQDLLRAVPADLQQLCGLRSSEVPAACQWLDETALRERVFQNVALRLPLATEPRPAAAWSTSTA